MTAAPPPHADELSRLTVETVTRDDDLGLLEQHWNELLQSASADTVFLTWEWITTWW